MVVDRSDELPPSAARGALAGLLGAGAALVTIELVGLLDARGRSVTETVEQRFIDDVGAGIKTWAIDTFGHNDKLALAVGTVTVVLALGALAGALARDRWQVTAAVYAAFALLGIVVALDDPVTKGGVAVVAAVLGAVVGAGTAIGLERRWRLPVGPDRGLASDEPVPMRRAVLVSGGIVAGVLLAGGWAARLARRGVREGVEAVSRVLPRPSRRVPVPAVQPFEVTGLTPYVVPTADFYRIDTAATVPLVDVDGWELRVRGMVDRERIYTFDQLLQRDDLVELPITLQCVSNEVGGDLVGNARWTGVPLATILREAGVQDRADQVIGESVDGFTAGFPLEAALDGRDAMVAIGMNGRTLPSAHGYPARLVVPGLYGYVSATKWLHEIRLTTFAEEAGYWIPLGWSRLGPIKTASRIDVPRPGDGVEAGDRFVAGVAWAPTRGISAVEVRIDGTRWQRAELGRVASKDTWVQWRLPWKARAGRHVIEVRAVDGKGRVQTSREAPPEPSGATGYHTIEVEVS